MDVRLNKVSTKSFDKEIIISGSKSESNRLLILQKLFPKLSIHNLANAKDTVVLQKALNSSKENIDIGHAGTAMRFLTAYFSTQIDNVVVLTGSERMQKRPIKILVDALRDLGAKIDYVNEEGFPPLRIKGKKITKNTVQINGNVSSQYISALLLIATSLENGLEIVLKGEITSRPYIEMTLSLLKEIGIKTEWKASIIKVNPIKKIDSNVIIVESDWSSASYFYSFVALKKESKIILNSFKNKSLQGDKALIEIYKNFGVQTSFKNDGMVLEQLKNFQLKKHITLNLIKTPDIAQTIAVTCFGLGISCDLTGLHTLKIKETDRLEALKNELEKFDAEIKITEDSFHLRCSGKLENKTKEININTYEDHRMAMAFAPLSLITPLMIKNAEVVNKSYPNFWKDLEELLA